MRSLTLVRSISISSSVVAAVVLSLAGCGDNKPGSNPRTDGGACSGSFVSPADLATLTEAADTSGTCTDGFQTNVTVAISEPDGTKVDLLVGTTKVATAMVSGAKVVFPAVQLAEGANMLKASVSATCAIAATVTVNCNVPVCTISKPTISATHPKLNGVPAANGGDRASSPGAPYQAEFDVMTDIEDGQSVDLKIANSAVAGTSNVYSGKAVAGKVVFAGLTLVPDGDYTAEATCTNKAGRVGHSTKGMFPVDATPPVLTISSPADGHFFGPTELTAGAFKVCAKTSSADAVALPATLGADAVKNLSVAVGTASPDPTNGSVPVPTVDTDTCVNVACTSSTPVDLTVTLKDGAGNPTTKVISQISCATTLPGVQIVSPSGDTSPFGDATKHLLAASSSNTLKDADAVKAGAQYTVVACSDKAGQATLLGGAMGGTLAAIAGPIATVAAVTADGCPTGSQVARFVMATIPDSALNADGTLKTATGLEVDVADSSTAVGKSPEVDLWVASAAPSVANYAQAAICNTTIQGTADVTKNVTLIASTASVTLTVTSTSGTVDYTAPTFQGGFVTFTGVLFKLGMNTVTAVATDKAGNSTALTQPCTVAVGTPPVVAFTIPTASQNLCAVGNASGACVVDTDGATGGWQGSLAVNVTVQGVAATSGTVTFTASSATAPLGTANIDAAGNATLTGITIPDGNPVMITATTSAIGANGVGTVTRTIVVDTVVPSVPAALTAVVKDRRQTSFTLSWTAPADGTGTAPVASYDIRYSLMPITTANFPAATAVSTGGSPQAPGTPETRDVTDLFIENDYYFALAAKDAAGNVSPVVLAAKVRASFNQTVITGPASPSEELGYYVDGSGNFVGDANSDILVGEYNGSHAYIFAGASNFTPPAPAVTFSGPMYFGGSIANIGDIDGDGLEDIAVSSAYEALPKVYIFKGRATWPATLASSNASYTITADAASGLNSASLLGYPIVKVGDINGDGVGDFGLGAYQAAAGKGAMIVVLGSAAFADATLSSLTTAGRAIPLLVPATALSFGSAATTLGAQSGTLVVGAFTAVSGAGQLYSYRWNGTTLGQVGTTYTGPARAQVGNILNVLGGGSGVISGSSTDPGSALAFFGGSLADPLSAAPVTFKENAATQGFGSVAFGGGFSGSNLSISFIGDSHPDLVLSSAREVGNAASIVYIVDGSQAASLASPVNVATAAQVKIQLPADWNLATLYSSAVKDVNGDGFGDIAIGETAPFAHTSDPGRVMVLW